MKKEDLKRIRKNKKRTALVCQLKKLLIVGRVYRQEQKKQFELYLDNRQKARLDLAQKMGCEKDGFINPDNLEREPICEKPFLVSSAVVESAHLAGVPLVEKLIDEAIQNNDEKKVEELVRLNVPGNKQSRLKVAFQRGYFEAAQYFVDKGDSINERNNRGQTLFHWAAKQWAYDETEYHQLNPNHYIDFLVKNHANPNNVDCFGLTAYAYAQKNEPFLREYVECLEQALEEKRRFEMQDAILAKDTKRLEQLVFESLSKSARFSIPRFEAALEQGYEQAAFYFAEQGDNVDIRNENGETLLAVAAAEMCYDKVCFLLSVDADPNAVDFAGAVPLMKACYNRNSNAFVRQSIIRELLENGANPVVFDTKWNSVYRYAKSGDVQLQQEVEFIKRYEPTVNYRMILGKVYPLVREV